MKRVSTGHIDWIRRYVRKSTQPCFLSLSLPKGYTCHPLFVFDSLHCCSSLYVVGCCTTPCGQMSKMGTNKHKQREGTSTHMRMWRQNTTALTSTEQTTTTTSPPANSAKWKLRCWGFLFCVLDAFLEIVRRLYEAFEGANMLYVMGS